MVRNGNVVYFLYLQYIYFNIFYIRLRRGGEVQGGDDILIFTETIEEHRKVTRRVLELLENNKLYL